MVHDGDGAPAAEPPAPSAFERASQEERPAAPAAPGGGAPAAATGAPCGGGAGCADAAMRDASGDGGCGLDESQPDGVPGPACGGAAGAARPPDMRPPARCGSQRGDVPGGPRDGGGAGWAGGGQWPGGAEGDGADFDAELALLMDVAAAGRPAAPPADCSAAGPGPGSGGVAPELGCPGMVRLVVGSSEPPRPEPVARQSQQLHGTACMACRADACPCERAPACSQGAAPAPRAPALRLWAG